MESLSLLRYNTIVLAPRAQHVLSHAMQHVLLTTHTDGRDFQLGVVHHHAFGRAKAACV